MRGHVWGDGGQTPGQLRLRRQHPVETRGKAIQGAFAVLCPVPGQAMVEKNVKHNAGIAPAGLAESRQRLIDQGMRGGIPDLATRSRTITLYTDKDRFRQALDLSGEDHITILLVDRRGEVMFRTQGAYRPDTAKELAGAVERQLAIV